MYSCEEHTRGHRTEEARDACVAKQKRRAIRVEKKKKDERRRAKNQEDESEDAYIKRRWCVEQTPAVNVISGLNRDYPKRPDGQRWDLPKLCDVHSEHIRWDGIGDWLKKHPKVLLPSEVRFRMGEVGVDEAKPA